MATLLIEDVEKDGKNKIALKTVLKVFGQKFKLIYYIRVLQNNDLQLYLIEGKDSLLNTTRKEEKILEAETTQTIREKFKEKYNEALVWE